MHGHAVGLREIFRMQQAVRLVTARLTQVLLIQPDDRWVLMRLADALALILTVDGSSTPAEYLAVTVVIRLATTADTTTRTCHDLNGMVDRLTASHIIQQLAGVTQSVSDPYIKGESVKIDRGGAYPLHAAQLRECHPLQLLSGMQLIGRAAGSLNHTTRIAEDDTGTCRLTQRIIKILLRQIKEVDVCLLDERCQLAGGDGEIHVGITIHLELIALTFILLRQAGHDGDHDHLFPLHPDLVGKV